MMAFHIEFAAWRGQGGLGKQARLMGYSGSCLIIQAVNSMTKFSQEKYCYVKKSQIVRRGSTTYSHRNTFNPKRNALDPPPAQQLQLPTAFPHHA